jgi:putative transcriptional regulator
MVYNPFKYKISELNSTPLERGKVLVAEPFMADHYFKRSVVLLLEHNFEGTVGMILNNSLDITLDQLITHFTVSEIPVYLGGPVQPQSLFYIHSRPDLIPESLPVAKSIYWSGDFEAVKEKLQLGQISSKEIRFFLGYSGWGKEQLNKEIAENSWFVQDISNKYVFGVNTKTLWKEIMENAEPPIAQMANFPEDPGLN